MDWGEIIHAGILSVLVGLWGAAIVWIMSLGGPVPLHERESDHLPEGDSR